MAAKKRGLGRGLDALLGEVKIDNSTEKFQSLPIESLKRGQFQPRRVIDTESLQELASSIRAQGIVQPIVVRQLDDDQYEIIAGERRWRAAQLAGLHEVPVVRRDASDQAAMAMALIENIQREDLNPLEEAEALQRLLKEFKMTHERVANAIGKSRAAVTNLLRLIDLHPDAKQLLIDGSIEMGHARALLALDYSKQAAAAQKVFQLGMTVRVAEQMVKTLQTDRKPQIKKIDPDVERLQDDLSAKLGTQVRVKPGESGRGRVTIDYTSLEQLEGILQKIR